MTDYSLKNRNIIKWYEYTMSPTAPEEAELPEESQELSEEPEEINLQEAGLDSGEAALVEEILNKFKDAKQNTVDDLFAAIDEEAPSLSEQDPDALIADICAPKQENVDALVRSAGGE